MTHTYLLVFPGEEGELISEEFTTETSRPSKVVKLLEKAFVKKFGKSLTELENFNLFKKKKSAV